MKNKSSIITVSRESGCKNKKGKTQSKKIEKTTTQACVSSPDTSTNKEVQVTKSNAKNTRNKNVNKKQIRKNQGRNIEQSKDSEIKSENKKCQMLTSKLTKASNSIKVDENETESNSRNRNNIEETVKNNEDNIKEENVINETEEQLDNINVNKTNCNFELKKINVDEEKEINRNEESKLTEVSTKSLGSIKNLDPDASSDKESVARKKICLKALSHLENKRMIPTVNISRADESSHIENDYCGDLYNLARFKHYKDLPEEMKEDFCAFCDITGFFDKEAAFSAMCATIFNNRLFCKQYESLSDHELKTKRRKMKELKLLTLKNNNAALEVRCKGTFKVGYSDIHGKGVFATRKIADNTFMFTYEGDVIGKCMSDKRERDYIANGITSIYMFSVGKDKIIDATLKGNDARFVNHSCNPNASSIECLDTGSIKYYSIRVIEAGEEITIDYCSNKVLETYDCNCGADNCRSKK